jgi:hypothetical protein
MAISNDTDIFNNKKKKKKKRKKKTYSCSRKLKRTWYNIFQSLVYNIICIYFIIEKQIGKLSIQGGTTLLRIRKRETTLKRDIIQIQ